MSTHVFSGFLNYDLPFGHGRAFGRNAGKIVNAILGDWRYDTIVSVHGGLPISMIQFGNDPTGAYFQPRPDCLAPSIATPYKNFVGGGYVWFDPTTMAIPGPGKLGNCPISKRARSRFEADGHEPVEEVQDCRRQVAGIPLRRHQRVQYSDLRRERLRDRRAAWRFQREPQQVRRRSRLHRERADWSGEYIVRVRETCNSPSSSSSECPRVAARLHCAPRPYSFLPAPFPVPFPAPKSPLCRDSWKFQYDIPSLS